MKFMCSAKLNEKGRTCYTWGKDQSAVILYNFSNILHAKANRSNEQLCVCSPVVAMCVSHAVSVAPQSEPTRCVLSEPDITGLVK